jgi:(R)-citramalyl-CoA lyase
MKRQVTIIDVAPRDGLQNEAVILPVPMRVALIERIAQAGIPRIEIGSFVNPKLVPQMADTAALYANLPKIEGVHYTALILNLRGYELATEAGLRHVRLVLAGTESSQRANVRRSIADTLDEFAIIAKRAQAEGIAYGAAIGASFGCPFEGAVPPTQVLTLAERLVDLGADELSLADTTGMGMPDQVHSLCIRVVELLKVRWPHIAVGVHLHNTRNTGYANAYAALQAGITSFDASLGGLGGCPFAPGAAGNIATEDLVHMLNGLGLETGVDLEALITASAWLAEQMGKNLPAMVGKAKPVYRGCHVRGPVG